MSALPFDWVITPPRAWSICRVCGRGRRPGLLTCGERRCAARAKSMGLRRLESRQMVQAWLPGVSLSVGQAAREREANRPGLARSARVRPSRAVNRFRALSLAWFRRCA